MRRRGIADEVKAGLSVKTRLIMRKFDVFARLREN